MTLAQEKINPTDPCIICGTAEGISFHLNRNGHNVFRCPHCSLMFVSPRPSEPELMKIYSADYFRRGNKYSETKAGHSAALNEQARVRLLLKHTQPGRLLDVGCATGGFMQAAHDAGFSVTGVEPSKEAADQAARNLNTTVHNCDLPSCKLTAASFDIITMWDVLEHLSDPIATLKAARTLLAPGGLIILSTGDARSITARLLGSKWHLMTPPQHLFFFSATSLHSILNQTGFKPEALSHEGKKASLEFISLKASESFGKIITPLLYPIKLFHLNNLCIYINLHDIITCVARTKDSQ